MEVQAKLKNALIAPRKARLAADLIRKKSVGEAMTILGFAPQKGARILKGVLESALANASHNDSLEKNNLFITSVLVQDGLVLKRYMPRAHGHASPILKKRSHIIITLGEIKRSTKLKEGRKTKMKTFSYEEVKKVMEEAKKASKMVKEKDKQEKAKMPLVKTIQEKKMPQKGIGDQTRQDSVRPKFTRLGDTFKKLFHRTTKKG